MNDKLDWLETYEDRPAGNGTPAKEWVKRHKFAVYAIHILESAGGHWKHCKEALASTPEGIWLQSICYDEGCSIEEKATAEAGPTSVYWLLSWL
jgi:hypothetical protein